nr:metallophosphoesterase [Desulfobacula sp.]
MKAFSRRDFLRYGGAGVFGLTLTGLNLPFLSLRKAKAGVVSDTAWKFGVMADTQWRTGSNGGEEPASCAVSIIDALNQEFIRHDCKFVIQVGDLVDVETVSGARTLPTREAHTQALYNSGIGFFPVRGNHEASKTAAAEIPALFPQTLGNGPHLFGAANFQSPILTSAVSAPMSLQGLSYAFDFDNVRCILLDQFTRSDGTNYDGTTSNNNNMVDQVGWVEEVLADKPADSHAFVFAHKNLIGQNHKDVLFGASLTANPGPRDSFITSLSNHGVRYCLGGHDHMHHRSIVTDSSKNAGVGQIICSSNSYKFYIPKAGDDGREIPVGQELFTIGYYIFTVDGPRVTVDFYSASHGYDYGDKDLIYPPSAMAFHLRDRFGYSLNGSQFEITRGGSYTGVMDSCQGTTVRILGGQNGNTETDYLNRSLTKTVNTGWSEPGQADDAAGMILTLWGLADNLSLYNANLTGLLPDGPESLETDIYALSLTYDPLAVRPSQLVSGDFALAARDGNGDWVNAADLNSGGAKTFKYGPWKPQYGLGTYGVDPRTKTVWAVINHEGDFTAKLV